MESASIWGVQFGWVCVPPCIRINNSADHLISQFRVSNGMFKFKCCGTIRPHHFSLSPKPKPKPVDAATVISAHNCFAKIHQLVRSPLPFPFLMNPTPTKFGIWLCVAIAILVTAVRVFVGRKSRYNRPAGSVADLVRRGQLRYDTRGISSPLKYEDPFNNPLMKVSKSNSTVEMCGKLYRLAPVTLTQEQQAIHQRRRSRAYHWKRPTVFLKEGDLLPPDVDPDTIRWIPANHPFATTATDIDEHLAQNNVYQKHGVPFRIQAEHEALHRKLEALQNEQKLNKLVIDSTNVKDFERPFKSHVKLNENAENCSINNQASDSHSSKETPNHFESPSSEDNPSL